MNIGLEDGHAISRLEDLLGAVSAAIAVIKRKQWVHYSEGLPEAGLQVAVQRKNGTWDRGEIAPIYFDGLPGWYMPEGPIPVEDAPYWIDLRKATR